MESNSLTSSGREILPTNIKPIHYDLHFEPDLNEAVEYEGSVVIVLDVVEKTSSISLNAMELDLIETELATEDGEKLHILELKFDESKEVVEIVLESELIAPGKVHLKMKFKGSHLHYSYGFFRSPVDAPDGTTKWMVSTQMQPTDARKVFPCFDEPALKATFTVTLVAENEFTCLSNMDVASEVQVISRGKPKKAVTFNPTPLMSTYLVCFAVGNFKMIQTDSFRVPVRVYAPATRNIDHGQFSLNLAARTLKVFEDIFDLDFPLPKMDLIAVPSASGAMENWGLVTFGESYLLIDQEESSAQTLRLGASVLVHELAHQWFGNIVTMDFWEGLWLNEGFADWAELRAWEALEPSWLMWQSFAAGAYQQGLELDSNKASHPIEVPVKRASDINQIFDDISYNKGCAVIRMMASYLGVEIFVKGIQWYLKKHAYGNTTSKDLWDALSHVSGKDVGAIMEKWTKYIGYPVVDVRENEDAGTITVTQHRFLQDGSSNPADDTLIYPLSLGLKTKEGVSDDVTLYTRTKDIKIALDFYKLNADHSGFYRVSYERERLKTFGHNAKDGFLSAEDKIGLLSDALAMASSGHSNAKTSDVLNLLAEFEDEPSYFVWDQIFGTITAIEKAFLFEDSKILNAIKVFQNRLMNKALKSKRWHFHKTDDGLEKMFKALLFAHGGEDKEVRDAANSMFEDFLAGADDAINVNILGAVFAIVLKNGGVKEYDAILQASQNARSVDKRDICLEALGNTRNPTLISRTLELAISPDSVARNDVRKFLSGLREHSSGIKAEWVWMRENADEIQKTLGNGLGTFARVVQEATIGLSTKEQWNDVRQSFAGKDTQSYDKYLAQALDTILAKANWVERDRDDVWQWLKDNGYTEEKNIL